MNETSYREIMGDRLTNHTVIVEHLMLANPGLGVDAAVQAAATIFAADEIAQQLRAHQIVDWGDEDQDGNRP